MTALSIPFRPLGTRFPAALGVVAFVLLTVVAVTSLVAQVGGERGIAPVASSADIDVSGIEVNVQGENAEDARANGWRLAQRLAWEQLGGPDIPDSRLESLVSAIVVEEESIGPRRYIARLGVIFDRQRAGALLGAGGAQSRSAPMLTLPVMITGGTQTMFEYRNDWQRAWAEYQFGDSRIDYVRPDGSGEDSLLLTYGQTGRRSRVWWNAILDEFGAADVLVPVARLQYDWPGGPVTGTFTARYGPDNRFLDSFTMRAESSEQLPAMLGRAVERFDEIFEAALADGTLRPDPTLTLDNIEISPEIRALLEQARAAEAAAAAAAAEVEVNIETGTVGAETPEPVQTATPAATYTVQVATPDGSAFDGALSNLRGTPGVSRVSISSTAMGGTSVFAVTYAGDLSSLAAALRERGWAVNEGQNALGISR